MDIIDVTSALGDEYYDQRRYVDISGLPDNFPECGVE
jgi:hypothetical protein